MLPDLYPVILYMLIPSWAAMLLNVSPDCTIYVRDAVVVLLLLLWHILSPGYTIDGFPLGTLTFHQSVQNIETYCPDWIIMQLVLHVVSGLLGILRRMGLSRVSLLM